MLKLNEYYMAIVFLMSSAILTKTSFEINRSIFINEELVTLLFGQMYYDISSQSL